LEHGTTVHDAPDGNVITPLSEAILLQNHRMVRVLEEKGAYERFNEWPPFHAAWMAAVTVGDQSLIEKLISMHKIIPAHELGCALSKASRDEDYDAAVILLNLGADLEASLPEAGRRPALIEAIKTRNLALINLFLDSGANPNNYEFGDSPIVLAAEWGNHSVVEALLMAGAKPIQGKVRFSSDELHGARALPIAVIRKDRILVSMLLEAGADINYKALAAATGTGDFDMTKWLLDRGADPHDSQALENAFLNNNSLFELLLKAHKDRYSSKRKGFGSAVLCNAIRSGRKTVVKSLLDHGADPNQFVYLDGQHVTPFFCAIVADEGRGTSLVKDLIKSGCSPHSCVSELGVTVQGRSTPRVTALLAAISTNSTSMVQLLVQEGAEINRPALGRIRRTPLQRAADIGSFETVQLCHNLGADINALPARIGGGTVLQLAAIGGFNSIVCYLLSYKAEVDVPSAKIDGMTALEGATAHGRLATISILLQASAGSGGKDIAQFERAISFAKKNRKYSRSYTCIPPG